MVVTVQGLPVEMDAMGGSVQVAGIVKVLALVTVTV